LRWSVGRLADALSNSIGRRWHPVELLETEGGLQFSDHQNTLAVVAIDDGGIDVLLNNERSGVTHARRFDWEHLEELTHSTCQLH